MKREFLKLIALKLSEQRKNRDFGKLIRGMNPTPGGQIRPKYKYFYEPYSSTCNTKKFMSFTEQDSQSLDLNSISGWKRIHEFMYKEDPRTLKFVLKQLHRQISGKKV